MTTAPKITTKSGADVQVGDVLDFCTNNFDTVIEIDPNGTHLIPGARLAIGASGSRITLDPTGYYRTIETVR